MLRSLKDIQKYTIEAEDGEIGSVDSFLFDDEFWMVRYIVVDTGQWLSGRKVLVSPMNIEKAFWWEGKVRVSLTKKQVENSPDIDTDKPVSRQNERHWLKYYGMMPYWEAPAMGVPPLVRPDIEIVSETTSKKAGKDKMEEEEKNSGDSHLRSSKEVLGYHIRASDGEIGHIEDFIAEDDTWFIRYIVVDTRNWLPGRKVLISPQWVEKISWAVHKVHIDLLRDNIKNSPEYDPGQPVNREYETMLYDYYGRPKYWMV
jgi:hypothetical protein